MLLKDKVAVVTGAASGIGEGIVQRFGEEGANVVLVDCAGLEHMAELAQAIAAKNDVKTLDIRADVTVSDDLDYLVESTIAQFGRIDILVNNAGVFYPRLLEDTLEEELRHTFDVNVLGPYVLTQKIVPHMKSRGKGSILFTGSIFGPSGGPHATSYGASKMAVHGLAISLAMELAPTIRVNVVAPGNVDTPMNYPLYDALGGRQVFVPSYPMGRLGLPSDIAAAASFLVSDQAGWITGAVLPVDGGYLAK